MGTKFPACSLQDHEVRAYREIERQDMHKVLDDYVAFCLRMGVSHLTVSLPSMYPVNFGISSTL